LGQNLRKAQMCNDYRLLTNAATLFDGFSEIKIKIRFSEGKPNIEAREDIKITDTAPVRTSRPTMIGRSPSWIARTGPRGSIRRFQRRRS
jgi:putative SOS response-associated peptidase YedK